MSDFTPAFYRSIKLHATAIGGPLSGQSLEVVGTSVHVMGRRDGRYVWVYSCPADDSEWIGSVWFAVWFPNG